MVATMEKTEEAAQRVNIERTEEIIKINTETQMQIMKAQFEEMSKDIFKRLKGKMEWMETKWGSKKRRQSKILQTKDNKIPEQ